jgi:hypothetical protein
MLAQAVITTLNEQHTISISLALSASAFSVLDGDTAAVT